MSMALTFTGVPNCCRIKQYKRHSYAGMVEHDDKLLIGNMTCMSALVHSK